SIDILDCIAFSIYEYSSDLDIISLLPAALNTKSSASKGSISSNLFEAKLIAISIASSERGELPQLSGMRVCIADYYSKNKNTMAFIMVPMFGSRGWVAREARSSARSQKKIASLLSFASLTTPNHFCFAKDLVLAPSDGTMKNARP